MKLLLIAQLFARGIPMLVDTAEPTFRPYIGCLELLPLVEYQCSSKRAHKVESMPQLTSQLPPALLELLVAPATLASTNHKHWFHAKVLDLSGDKAHSVNHPSNAICT
jgi:hypothetical protein